MLAAPPPSCGRASRSRGGITSPARLRPCAAAAASFRPAPTPAARFAVPEAGAALAYACALSTLAVSAARRATTSAAAMSAPLADTLTAAAFLLLACDFALRATRQLRGARTAAALASAGRPDAGTAAAVSRFRTLVVLKVCAELAGLAVAARLRPGLGLALALFGHTVFVLACERAVTDGGQVAESAPGLRLGIARADAALAVAGLATLAGGKLATGAAAALAGLAVLSTVSRLRGHRH